MKQQQGFTLVAVLIMAAMAGVLVLSSMRDNQIQERLTGNYQKKLNSRLVSEKGVFDSQQAIINLLAGSPGADIDDIIRVGSGESNLLSGEAGMGDMSYSASVRKNVDGLIEITSDGTRFEGASNMVALFEYVKGSTIESPFERAISGCTGVTVGGGAKIDSYDSSINNGNEAYSSDKASNGANVGTIYQDANIVLSGRSPIWGSVLSTGNVTLEGSTFIGQDLKANGDVILDAAPGAIVVDGYPENTNIAGNVFVGGDLSYLMAKTYGFVRVKGNFKKMGTAANVSILNAVHRNTERSLKYVGNLLDAPNQWNSPVDFNNKPFTDAIYKVAASEVVFEPVPSSDPNDPPEDTSDPTKNCDPLSIKASINEGMARQTSLGSIELGTAGNGHLTMTKDSAEHFINGTLTPSVTSVFNFSGVSAYTFDGINIQNGTLRFKHSGVGVPAGGLNRDYPEHVMVFVKGDFTHANDGKFIIDDGVVVTFLVTGRINLKKGIDSQSVEGVNKKLNLPTLSFYSSYEAKANNALSCKSVKADSFGVAVTADSHVYASIYAPNTDIVVTAAGSFSGAMRGNSVTTCGDGDIHYDEALGKIAVGGGGSGGTSKLVFRGWRY